MLDFMNSKIWEQYRQLCQQVSHNHSICLNTAGLTAKQISEGKTKMKEDCTANIFSLLSFDLVSLANLFTLFTYLFFNYFAVISLIPALKFTTGEWIMYPF